jgi:DNA helicase-2/ATP-dependent DNA helicase PcrA
MSNLNSSQKIAVEYNDGPLLIVAGAGTGKTTVITEKIAYLINNKLARAEEILAVTFTEKATTEMENRVQELLSFGGFDVTTSTFHGLCQQILESHALDIGIPNNFKLLNQTESWLLVRQNLDKFNLDYYRPLGNPTKFIHAMIKHFQKCKDELVTPANYLEYAQSLNLDSDLEPSKKKKKKDEDSGEDMALEIKRINELAEAYHVYNQLLLDSSSLDFADLIFYTVKLFKERPNVLKFYQKRFKYILVDEFQDTNYSQYELIKLLVTGGDIKLTVVGDDDQSIYKFRGASVSNILQFKDDFPKSKEVVLTENYRSGQKILDLAYNFIQLNNPDRLEDKLKINKKLKAQTKKVGDYDLLFGQNPAHEADLLCKKILELKEKNKELKWNDFAVLCRANSFADQFIPYFNQLGIPYEFSAPSGLFRQKVVLDSLAFLRLCDNYHESSAVYRILNCPVFSIYYSDLSQLLLYSRRQTVSLFEAIKVASRGVIKLSKHGQEVIEKLINITGECTQLSKQEPAGRVLYKFWEKSGYLKLLSDNVEKYQIDILYLQSLFEKIDDFQKNNGDMSVRAWLTYFETLLESGDDGEDFAQDTKGDAVKIMSVHAAKGLEFEYVFIPNFVDQRFPTNNRSTAIDLPDALVREATLPSGDAHMQEERRLLYVAITRAKQGVYFTAAKNYGGARDKKLSKFIMELESTNQTAFSREIISSGPTVDLEQKSSEIPIETFELEIPKEFSFSQLQSFDKCPWQYRFQFILRVPTFGKGVFSFGKTMHSTLQKFYQQMIELNSAKQNSLFAPTTPNFDKKVKVPSLDNLKEIYKEAWQDSWFQSAHQKQEYKKKGIEILEDFYERGEKEGWNVPITVEKGFRFRLKDNVIKGQIDRIDQTSDGQLIIIDYKTGKPKEKLTAEDKSQLLIYQIASESVIELRNLGEVAELRYYYLDNNSIQSFKGTNEEIEKEKIKIDEIIGEIKKKNFIPKPNKETCQFCDFKDICDFRI